MMVNIEVEGSEIMMEVDTGASVSLVSEGTYHKYWLEMGQPYWDGIGWNTLS